METGKINLYTLHLPWALYCELERNFASHHLDGLSDLSTRADVRPLNSMESFGLNAS